MDYERVLRRSKAAFEEGDIREGLRLLDLAAGFERTSYGAPNGSERE